MSENAQVVNDPVDMGHRVFLAGFFTLFGLESILAVVGYGQTRSPWLALTGLCNVLFLVALAQYLYAGSRKLERFVWIIAVVFLSLAILFPLMWRLTSGYVGRELAFHLFGQFLLPFLFAVVVATPAVRTFLAHQRGEGPKRVETPVGELQATSAAGEPVSLESILETSPPGVVGTLREDLKRPALNYSRLLRVVAGLLVLCAAGGIALAVLSLLSKGPGWTLIFASIFAFPPVFVLLALADDWTFLATTKGYEKAHLANIVNNSRWLGNAVIASIVVLALLTILEIAMR